MWEIASCRLCGRLMRNVSSECKTPNCHDNVELLHSIHQLLHIKILRDCIQVTAVCTQCESTIMNFVQFQALVRDTQKSRKMPNSQVGAVAVEPLLPKTTSCGPASLFKRRQTMCPEMNSARPINESMKKRFMSVVEKRVKKRVVKRVEKPPSARYNTRLRARLNTTYFESTETDC